MGVHVVRALAALIKVGVWGSLMVAAYGLSLAAGWGPGLIAAGVSTAGLLFFVVDLPEPREKPLRSVDGRVRVQPRRRAG